MVRILTQGASPRLTYTLELLFKQLLGLDYEIVAGERESLSPGNAWINYTPGYIRGMMNIHPHDLLFERGIRDVQVAATKWGDIPVLFPVSKRADMPFDPLAMIFYLVSRYEEYHDRERDKHGRFRPEDSLAFRHGFLDVPVINRLAGKILKELTAMFPGKLNGRSAPYCFVPTIDVDIAYAHLSKGWLRQLGGYGKLLLKGKAGEMLQRSGTLLGLQKDPYDNFAFQDAVFDKHGVKAIYFFLLGDHGRNDKNASWENPRFRKLIRRTAEKHALGIHPSYRSYDEPGRIRMETSRLAEITGKEVTRGRLHFLRMRFPGTYRELAAAGIRDDYSMGYASRTGFRAGISTPFYFYDIPAEKATSLRVHPFAFMDTTLSDYLSLSPSEYLTFVKPMVREVKKNGGELTAIWHNYALAADPLKHRAFEDMIKLCAYA
ncbi:MAG: polysaccharide deacetylase family protein [Bacteroidales bacterium]